MERLGPSHLQRGAELLWAGALVAIPTETVYGLAALALHPGAVERLFLAKGRKRDHPLTLLCPDLDTALSLWRAHPARERARTLGTALWPGPLTLVAPRERGATDALAGDRDTVGVRVPDHPLTQALLQIVGAPLAAPSANLTGAPPPTCAQEVVDGMGERIDALLDGGPCVMGTPSTVVDVCEAPFAILRQGALSASCIRDALAV